MYVRPVTYADYRRNSAESGDILLCRAASLEGRFISEVTREAYSHVAMAGWINGHRRDDPTASALMMSESIQHHGKRVVPLSGEIQAWSGYYDVYRVKDRYPRMAGSNYDGELAFAWMARAAGSRYGTADLLRVLCRRYLPWPFNRIAAAANSDDPTYGRDCACQGHACMRAAGGPILKLNDSDAVPGDFSDPTRFQYFATLFWSQDEVAHALAIQDARRSLEAAQWDAFENGGADDEEAA